MIAATLATLVLSSASIPPPTGDAELGRVRFGSDVDAALKTSADTGKPVFLLFQEIPGCSTCKGFGAGPLTHPLLVEAIETLFVPVAIHNNREGADAAALKRFGEPAWNNPVVRYLRADGHDLLPREEGVWSTAAVAAHMLAALKQAKRPIPTWLALTTAELDATQTERAVFAMHCFWEGQVALGGLAGVVDAKPSFLDGAEVVEVTYMPSVLAWTDLVKKADALDCALHVYHANKERVREARAVVGERAQSLTAAIRPAAPSDDLRHLRSVRKLDLVCSTRSQAVHANAALAKGETLPADLLSPRQLELSAAIERALAKKSPALDGLTRPSDPAELATYVDELRKRLGDG